MLNEWAKGNVEFQVKGGESPVQVLERQKPVVNAILSKEDEHTILVCMHGRAIRILLCYLMNKNLIEMDSFLHVNLGLYVLEYDGHSCKIVQNNSQTHLNRSNN